MHEFSHVVHEDKLFQEMDGEALLGKFEFAQDKVNIKNFQRKYGRKVSRICTYATKDPLETISCDLSSRIAQSIDRVTLLPTKNPFAKLPYKEGDLSLYQKLQMKFSPLNKILRNFWNGKFN